MNNTRTVQPLMLLALALTFLVGGLPSLAQLPSPLYEWRLDARALRGDTVHPVTGGLRGRINGDMRKLGHPAAIDFGANAYVELTPKGRSARLPQRRMTAEAWVALRSVGEWGGFVGYIQDNGGYEKGWVLGNRQARFSFAISSTGADDGDGSITYLTADSDIPLGRWCHVVGTYDGRETRIYVDGELRGSTAEQSGDVLYADSEFVLGAYKDDNESFPIDGALYSVCLYAHALTEAQVAARYNATRGLFASAGPLPAAPGDVPDPVLIDGPWVTFENQQDAIVHWGSRDPMVSVVEFSEAQGGDPAIVRGGGPRRLHAVRLAGLRRNTEYRFRVVLGSGTEAQATGAYPLNTEFDFSTRSLPEGPSPYPVDDAATLCARAAEYILAHFGIDRGYCIDYGCGDGRLAYEIARRSHLQVVGISTDREAVRMGRRRLLDAGLYGSRITLRHLESLADLPFPDLCANLVISGEALVTGRLPGRFAEATSKLRPEGGKAYFAVPLDAGDDLGDWLAARPDDPQQDLSSLPDVTPTLDPRIATGQIAVWAVIARDGPLPGAGEWTHAYGDAGQSANSFDELLSGTAGETLEIQWFGLPGPNAIIDRQVRMEGPVSAAGRIFTQGNNRIIAQDAYNGTILWSMEIPHLRRTNLPRNTGNACCGREGLFVAVRDHCWRLDSQTGRRTRSYHVSGDESDTRYDWGCVALEGDVLLGSAVQRGNMDTGYIGPQYWFDEHSGPNTHNVCSDILFADRIEDGERVWTYQGGPIINPTIAIDSGRIFFLESRSSEVINSPPRKLGSELWSEVYLVALDVRTGETLWEQPYVPGGEPIVVYVVAHSGQVAVVASRAANYHVSVCDASSGEALWEADDPWRSDNHGHHIQHAVLAQGRMFLEPHVYEWSTGEKVDIEFPGRSKCGTITGAANLLHYRDYNDEVWDLATNTQSEFTRLRSNCWVGMISGSGLLMSPESGGGCSCQWPIYTSLVYRTKDDY